MYEKLNFLLIVYENFGMDSLPLEIINYLLNKLNPKDYVQFILAYGRATQLYSDEELRDKYKKPYLKYIPSNVLDMMPMDIIHIIMMNIHPKDYTNFILAYDVAQEVWNYAIGRKWYKEQFITYIETDHETYSVRKDNDKKHGKSLSYYPDGKLHYVTDYVNGNMHGKHLEYYVNSQLHYDIDYVNGNIHGKYLVYYDNGKLLCDIDFVNGRRLGKYMNYYDNGQLQHDIDYVNGRIHGKYLIYCKNGQLHLSYNYVNGRIHGEFVRCGVDSTIC